MQFDLDSARFVVAHMDLSDVAALIINSSLTEPEAAAGFLAGLGLIAAWHAGSSHDLAAWFSPPLLFAGAALLTVVRSTPAAIAAALIAVGVTAAVHTVAKRSGSGGAAAAFVTWLSLIMLLAGTGVIAWSQKPWSPPYSVYVEGQLTSALVLRTTASGEVAAVDVKTRRPLLLPPDCITTQELSAGAAETSAEVPPGC